MNEPEQMQISDSQKQQTRGYKLKKLGKYLTLGIIFSFLLFLVAPYYADWVNEGKNEALVEEIETIINKKVQEPASPLDIDKETIEEIRQLSNSSSHYQRGLSETLLGNYDAAENEYSMAIVQQAPFLVKCHIQRGNARFLGKRFADALEDYTIAAELDPTNAIALSNKGCTLSYLGKHEEALNAYIEAIKLDPNLANPWLNMVGALDYLGRYGTKHL